MEKATKLDNLKSARSKIKKALDILLDEIREKDLEKAVEWLENSLDQIRRRIIDLENGSDQKN